MPFPNLLGACGRSVVLEGGVKSLKSYLSDSFDVRAGLAVQVLQLVEDFEVSFCLASWFYTLCHLIYMNTIRVFISINYCKLMLLF